LQRPLPGAALRIVATGEKQDSSSADLVEKMHEIARGRNSGKSQLAVDLAKSGHCKIQNQPLKSKPAGRSAPARSNSRAGAN
jgi:hypothetical protein